MARYEPNFADFSVQKKKKTFTTTRFANLFTHRLGARLPASPHHYPNDKHRNTIGSRKPYTIIKVKNDRCFKCTGCNINLLHRRFQPRELSGIRCTSKTNLNDLPSTFQSNIL